MDKYKVTGMTCAACSSRVEKAAKGVSGVTSCSVNLLTGDMLVEGGNADELIAAVKKAGYGAFSADGKNPQKSDSVSPENDTKPIAVRLCVSAVLLAVLMYISMGHVMWGFPLPAFLEKSPSATALAELLHSAVILVANQHFFTSGV